jgi:hypothetical protein
MLRVLLLVSSLLLLTVDVGSAAVVFYSDRALWNAGNSATAGDDFNTVNFGGVQSSPYVSSTGASFSSPYASNYFSLNTQTGSNSQSSTGSGDAGIGNGPTQVWENDLGSGRYLTPGQGSYFDSGVMRQWGRQEETWNAATGQWDSVINNNFLSYLNGSTQTSQLDVVLPAGFRSAAFDLGQISGSGVDRTFRVIVTTALGETATIDVTNIFGSLTFFGFQAGSGDTIASLRLSALFVPAPDPNRGNWSYEANNTYRSRAWDSGMQSFYDQYQIGFDNLWLGNANGGNPPPPPVEGEVPEPSSWLLMAGGLFVLARRRRRNPTLR